MEVEAFSIVRFGAEKSDLHVLVYWLFRSKDRSDRKISQFKKGIFYIERMELETFSATFSKRSNVLDFPS
jgi:hypothetical protein